MVGHSSLPILGLRWSHCASRRRERKLPGRASAGLADGQDFGQFTACARIAIAKLPETTGRRTMMKRGKLLVVLFTLEFLPPHRRSNQVSSNSAGSSI